MVVSCVFFCARTEPLILAFGLKKNDTIISSSRFPSPPKPKGSECLSADVFPVWLLHLFVFQEGTCSRIFKYKELLVKSKQLLKPPRWKREGESERRTRLLASTSRARRWDYMKIRWKVKKRRRLCRAYNELFFRSQLSLRVFVFGSPLDHNHSQAMTPVLTGCHAHLRKQKIRADLFC